MMYVVIFVEVVIIIVGIVALAYLIGLIHNASQWLKDDNNRKQQMFELDYQLKSKQLNEQTKNAENETAQEKDYVFCPMCGAKNDKNNVCCKQCGYNLK